MTRNLRLAAILLVPAALLLAALALHAISPWRQPGPLSQVLVGPDRASAAAFDARSISCATQESSGAIGDALRLRATCRVTVAGQPLVLQVQHRGVIGQCTASYGGRALPCESAIPFYNADVPAVFVRADLGLPVGALRSLPGTNPVFYVAERDWSLAQVAFAALVALAATLLYARGALPAPGRSPLAWAARATGYAAGGLAVFGAVWYALLFVLLSSRLVD